ncbi:MAG: hypothetical protein M1832_003644 [Thelocarpon impressellum]|nr:MAG: hypothetical protein M1832_003644 [Thelocarpon impressellum]
MTCQNFLRVLVDPADANVDIVAVHGLNPKGFELHAEDTWTKEGKLWLKDFLPARLPRARILLYGYNASVAFGSSAAGVKEQAETLLETLHSNRELLPLRPIVWVCHSLGGIVVKRALVSAKLNSTYRPTCSATRGIAFFGTPHNGGRHAKLGDVAAYIARGVLGNPPNTLMAALKEDSLVGDYLRDDFRHQVEDYHVLSFYETRPYSWSLGLIVDKKSATLGLSGAREKQIAVDTHHSDICKFASADGDDFKLVAGSLVELVDRAVVASQEPRPLRAQDVALDTPASDRRPFNLPYAENPRFVGRDSILTRLRDQLRPVGVERASRPQTRAALYGLGGVGEHPESSVFWVHASTVARFQESFQQIARVCDIPGTDDPKADRLFVVAEWLKRPECGGWLMIVDNADDTDLFFAPGKNAGLVRYIPRCPHGAVLVTTRNKQAGVDLLNGVNLINVPKMDEVESQALMRTRLEDQDLDDKDLERLTMQLEHLPLALTQAAAYMQRNSVSLDVYLSMLEATPTDLLKEHFEDDGRDSDIPNAVTATWWISFEQIRQRCPRAAEMLAMMTFLDRQDIPTSLLEQEDESRPEFEKARGLLEAFSLVTGGKGGRNLDLHRLVQLVTRRWLESKGEAQAWAGQALAAVSERFPFGSFEDWKDCAAYLPHAQAVVGYRSSTDLESLLKARLLHKVACYLLSKGLFQEAEKLCLQAVELRRRLIGNRHPNTLLSMGNLATSLYHQGRLKEAEELEVEVLDMRKEVLGLRHPDTLISMGNLAISLQQQGRWKEAEELEVEVLDMRKEVLGLRHPDTLRSMGNLALTRQQQGRWKEAEELEVEVLDMTKEVLGLRHPDTLRSMGNLALTRQQQGRWKEAEELEVEVLDMMKEVLGLRHPDTLISMGNLASTRRQQGRWKEAEELEVEVLDMTKEVLGLRHPDTLRSMGNLASTRQQQGRWKEAEELEIEVLEMCKEVVGRTHPDTLNSMGNLAGIYRRQERLEDSQKLEQEVKRVRKASGQDPDVAGCPEQDRAPEVGPPVPTTIYQGAEIAGGTRKRSFISRLFKSRPRSALKDGGPKRMSQGGAKASALEQATGTTLPSPPPSPRLGHEDRP